MIYSDLKIGHQDSSTNNGRQSDTLLLSVPYRYTAPDAVSTAAEIRTPGEP